jgi:hypothetical protein
MLVATAEGVAVPVGARDVQNPEGSTMAKIDVEANRKRRFTVYHYEDAEALYIDGELHTAQHSVEELVYELLGVELVYDSAFMKGQTSWAGVADTIDEVNAYAEARQAKLDEVARLRSEAAAALKRASELEREVSGGKV